jgi:hypothetical protein
MSFFKGFADELLKLGFHENWGVGGQWSAFSGQPVASGSPLLHEQGVPYDVEWKNYRRDYFQSRMMPPEEGIAVVPGRLAPSAYKGTDQEKLEDKDKGKSDGKRR